MSRTQSLLEMDYEQIEDRLIGPNAWKKGKKSHFDPVAVPQGNIFLLLSKPIRSFLKTAPLFYRR